MSAEVTLKLAFYGDDFTGSTDALEALARCGLRTALFLSPPDGKALARVGPLDAFGVAGDSRTMTPQQMDTALPAVFDALARSGAPIVHYKVCSTFDSAPGIGSIGHAMEIARSHFHQSWIPVVGGTPALRRAGHERLVRPALRRPLQAARSRRPRPHRSGVRSVPRHWPTPPAPAVRP